MNWREKSEELKAWWDAAGADERYLAIVLVSSGISLAAVILTASIEGGAKPRETFHRVRIEQP